MKQKDVFLQSEADAWFERNIRAIETKDFSTDPLVNAINDIVESDYLLVNQKSKIIEIGCGEGRRLEFISKQFNAEVFGVEPSTKAVELARRRGVCAVLGTADSLPFDSNHFDILLFGFCLYLCDRNDLFKIACEADRVLKENAWLIIHDFYSTVPVARTYHHKQGLFSFKMDYRVLFEWHPAYTCFQHKVSEHGACNFIDDPQEWVATSILRKMS